MMRSHASRRAPRLNRTEFCLLIDALACVATFGGVGSGATDCFEATSSRQRMSLMGREHAFADRDSGRSGGLNGPWRSRRRLHIHVRSLRRRDGRRGDGCFVAGTAG